MKASHRGMRVPGALGAVPVEDTGQPVGIFGEVLQLDGAILEEGHRLRLAFLAHHDVEAGFAPFGHPSLHRRVKRIDHAAAPVRPLVPAKAEITHHLVKPGKTAPVLLHVLLDENKRTNRPKQ